MRRKLKSSRGFTLVEMLAASIVLILLGLMMNTGFQMAMRTYRTLTARSELDLLLSTAVDALSDDLRYAQDVSGSGGSFTYTSDSFGSNTSITVDTAAGSASEGQLLANGLRMLSTGAYGLNKAYVVKQVDASTPLVSCAADADSGEVTFTIELMVSTRDAADPVTARTPEGGITVRCLNRAAAAGGP